MIDDTILTSGLHTIAEPPNDADQGDPAGAREAGRPMRRPPLPYPPRLEISPLTIRSPAAHEPRRLPVH